MKNEDYRLYLVSDDTLPDTELARIVEQAVLGGVTMVQLREKHGDTRRFLRKAQRLTALLQGTNVPLIINDRVDIALAVDADGVHLGQQDMPVELARALLGAQKIIGLSVESHDQLLAANHLPIDYIGLSAIYPTPTKTDTQFAWQLDGLQWALAHSHHPIVAIGGINAQTLAPIAQTGVHGIALVSAICHDRDPQSAARALRTVIDNAGNRRG